MENQVRNLKVIKWGSAREPDRPYRHFEPRNQSVDVSELHKFRQSKLENGERVDQEKEDEQKKINEPVKTLTLYFLVFPFEKPIFSILFYWYVTS